ncbi:MAG: LamG domain-containing protein [Deltaproteobacteria bacterium]|nr:LamG domain-containing protein [Deltaproteobacteria bacterium]
MPNNNQVKDSNEKHKVLAVIPCEHRLPGLLFLCIEIVFISIAYNSQENVKLLAILMMGIVACVFLLLFFSNKKKWYSSDEHGASANSGNGNVDCLSACEGGDDSVPCFDDNERYPIVQEFKPSMYLPLEHNFMNLISQVVGSINSKNIPCNTNVFPYVDLDQIEFIPNRGLRFYGKNMLTVHSMRYYPFGKEARTFIFAAYPTEKPKDECPMFFFAYGKRKNHDGNTGYTNHDKSFGLFWGEPAPRDEVDDDYKGVGLRVFFYCEHDKRDRTSEYCDTKVIANIDKLNRWYVFSVSYDGDSVKVYVDGVCVHDNKYDISTSKTSYLNIGGFVHHDEDGGILARDLDYSMNGFVREFMMFREVLTENQVQELSGRIRYLLKN